MGDLIENILYLSAYAWQMFLIAAVPSPLRLFLKYRLLLTSWSASPASSNTVMLVRYLLMMYDSIHFTWNYFSESGRISSLGKVIISFASLTPLASLTPSSTCSG
jgi:hypothetical protein